MPKTSEVIVDCSILAGLIPTERIAGVMNASGEVEEVLVSERSIRDKGMVAFAIQMRRADGAVLIELPRETSSGKWRIWVKKSTIRS